MGFRRRRILNLVIVFEFLSGPRELKEQTPDPAQSPRVREMGGGADEAIGRGALSVRTAGFEDVPSDHRNDHFEVSVYWTDVIEQPGEELRSHTGPAPQDSGCYWTRDSRHSLNRIWSLHAVSVTSACPTRGVFG